MIRHFVKSDRASNYKIFEAIEVSNYPRKRKNIVTLDQIKVFYEYERNDINFTGVKCKYRLSYQICIIQFYTGLSFIDVMQLSYDLIVAYSEGYAISSQRQKTNAVAYIPIPKVIEVYFDFSKKSGLVFETVQAHTHGHRLIKISNRFFDGVKITSHCFRASYATYLDSKGVGIQHIGALMAHRSLKTTAVYINRNKTTVESIIDKVFNNNND